MILDQFRLDGKTALVTGCRRGIGLAMARALAEAGADVIGVSAALEQGGSDVERAVTGLGRSFMGYRADFARREDLYRFIGEVQEKHPGRVLLKTAFGSTRIVDVLLGEMLPRIC